METNLTIPLTAWQQAAVIGLFIVFVALLLQWFSKQTKTWRDFMMEMNNHWQNFNKEQRTENTNAMCNVNENLQELIIVTKSMVTEMRELRFESREIIAALQSHDLQAREILVAVEKLTPSRAIPKSSGTGTQRKVKNND